MEFDFGVLIPFPFEDWAPSQGGLMFSSSTEKVTRLHAVKESGP